MFAGVSPEAALRHSWNTMKSDKRAFILGYRPILLMLPRVDAVEGRD